MAEPNKQQIGDGGDDYAQAAQKTAEAAKKISTAVVEKSAAAGAEAGANAAAATVQASVEGGKAVAEIAAGTAAGGPWGAIISAAWALRHTLFKILISICLSLLFIIAAIVSLPSIVFNQIFHTDPDTVDAAGLTDMHDIYDDMAFAVNDSVSKGYDMALAEVERIIADGGYDYEMSMEALINYGHASADYDIAYVLAAYSASLEQRGTSKADMTRKLDAVAKDMFKVTFVEKEFEREVEVVPEEDDETIPENETGTVTTEIVKYAECTIHPFDQSVILKAFGIDPSAIYSQFNITNAEAIRNMASALKMTLYGTVGAGDIPELTDAELIAFLDRMNCSATRKELIRVALSLVGRVPYFWGGKSPAGWNDQWNTPRLVRSSGSTTSGSIRPYGMDCSGFTDWVYKTALGKGLPAGSSGQWRGSTPITEAELLPGDLGFMGAPGEYAINHVLMYAGKSENGQHIWVHCASSAGGTVLNSPGYVKHYRRPNGFDLESNTPPRPNTYGDPIQTLRVNVTHYCPCSKCCGKWAGGPTASGKMPQPGMVAMSSHYPFGTLIEINGVMYTVEDRGGSGIEKDIARVDIFVRDHQQALRLGRFDTDAKIYRLGR